MIKRFCHHHSRHIIPFGKKSNPLVECEKKCMTSINSNRTEKCVYINDKLVSIENTPTISIRYIDKHNKFCKIEFLFL